MAMPNFTMRQLLEAGVHFGHQTRRWNPKMAPYLFGVRNGVHIIDLTQTVPLLHRALVATRDVAAAGGRILFVGTKRQAQEPVTRSAKRSGQYYVNHRWLGGMLTNWKTISQSIRRLRELEGRLAEGTLGMTKKETLQLTRERDKLERALGGIKDMGGLPDLIFVIDTNKEAIVIAEAKVLGIPVVAVVDSNSAPDGIAYPVPGNDDASRAINLYCDLMVGAVLDGIQAEMAASGADLGAIEELPEELAVAEELAPPEELAAAEETAPPDEAAGSPGDGPNGADEPGADGSEAAEDRDARSADAGCRGRERAGSRAGGAQRLLTGDRRAARGPAQKRSHQASAKNPMAEITANLVKQLRDQTGAGMMDCKAALTETGGDLEDATDWLRKKGLAAAAKKAGRLTADGLIGLQVEARRGALVEVNSETDFVARNEVFQKLVRAIAAVAPRAGGDLEALLRLRLPDSGRSVADEITHTISVLGENINLRRTAAIAVDAGVVGSYVHGALAPGLGKIGVLVGLHSAGDAEQLAAFGKQLAMHIAAARPQAVTVDRLVPAMVERERAIYAEQARASGKPDSIVDKMVEGRMRKYHEEVVLLEQVFVLDTSLKVKDAIDRLAETLGSSIAIAGFVRFALGEGLEPKPTNLAAEVAQLARA